MEIILEGPYFTMEDLEPHLRSNLSETVSCVIPGLVGPITMFRKSVNVLSKHRKEKYLVIKQGKRTQSVDFTRGEPLVLVRDKDKTYLMLRRSYDSRERQKSTPIYGS